MDEITQIKQKCPRCGYEDIGKYCSQCSCELDSERENVFREMYHSVVSKFFDKLPFLWKFTKTWCYSFFTPGRINIKETYKSNCKYLNDIKFVTTLFYITVGSAIVKSIFTFEASDTVMVGNSIFNFFLNLFVQSYVLWIFGFMLLAFIWTGRIWRKWMKMEIKEQRQFDSNFIYECGTILTIVIILFWIIDFNIGDPITPNLKTALIIFAILIVLHFLYSLLSIGVRSNAPKIRLIVISFVCTYIFVFVALVAEIVTIPMLLLPILVILSPLFYLFRNLYRTLRG